MWNERLGIMNLPECLKTAPQSLDFTPDTGKKNVAAGQIPVQFTSFSHSGIFLSCQLIVVNLTTAACNIKNYASTNIE